MSNVIVVGCGRVGSQLANMLSDNGNNVCVIDKNVNAFANLGRNFNGSTVQGVGSVFPGLREKFDNLPAD